MTFDPSMAFAGCPKCDSAFHVERIRGARWFCNCCAHEFEGPQSGAETGTTWRTSAPRGKLLAVVAALFVAMAVEASAQPIFVMDYGRDSGGWPGTVGSRVTHTQQRIPGGGPSGQDAIEMRQLYAPTADRYGAEFDWGWNGDLEASDPPAGSRRYYRWRMRFSPDTNLRGVYSGNGSGIDLTNKVLIVGDGCGSNCRVIVSYRGGSADGRPRYWRVALDGGVDPITVTNIPPNGEWFTVQLEITTGPTGGYKLWINNPNYATPTGQMQRLVNPTRHRYVFFGAYNNDGLQSSGVHTWRHSDFQYALSFDPTFAAGGTAPPSPVDCAVSSWTLAGASPWGACVGGSQTRNETWARSIVTPPSNGGAVCPALTETRTAAQACSTEPPPVEPPPSSGEVFRADFSTPSAVFDSSGYGSLAGSSQFAVVNGALVHTIPAGASQQYITQHLADARTGPVAAVGPALVDVYAKWTVTYAPGFDFAAEPKQMILGTQDARRHDNACCNPWTAHYMTVFVSAQGQILAEGNNKQAASGQWLNLGPFVPVTLTTGRPYVVEVRRRLNDFGQDNGIFQMWVDGVLIADRTNVRWRTAWDGTFGSDASGTNFLMVSDYFNGGARSVSQQIAYDDITISTTRAGAPPPVACVGTWGTWTRVAGSETACVNGMRTFNEARLFTVITSGAGCPVSPETRTVGENCTPPPAPVLTCWVTGTPSSYADGDLRRTIRCDTNGPATLPVGTRFTIPRP